MKTTENKVIEWLNKLPNDNLKDLELHAKFSYDDWFVEGRRIPDIIKILIELLNRENLSKPSTIAERIAYALGWIGDDSAFKTLINTLNSKDMILRSEAIAALGRLACMEAFNRIKEILLDKSQDSNVRANACIAIGNLAHPESEKVLNHALDDQDAFVTLCAKEALRLLTKTGDR